MNAKKTACTFTVILKEHLIEICLVVVICIFILATYITSINIADDVEQLGGWNQIYQDMNRPDGR